MTAERQYPALRAEAMEERKQHWHCQDIGYSKIVKSGNTEGYGVRNAVQSTAKLKYCQR